MAVSSNNNNINGHVESGWESVKTAFEQNFNDGSDIGAGLCVYYRGECVINLTGGWKETKMRKEPYTSETLQLVFSVSKGVLAAALARCVENGWLNYQAPVTRYWPEFAANDKQNITVGDVLSHRAGLPCVEKSLTPDEVFDWNRITSLLAAQAPFWTPGSEHGYHAYTLGFLGGELIHRVDPKHRPYGQFIHEELDPEFYCGVIDDNVQSRIAHLLSKEDAVGFINLSQLDILIQKAMTCNYAFPFASPNSDDYIFNQPRLYQAVLPAVNGITNAHALARIYASLIGDIQENGQRKTALLSKETLALATENVTPPGEPDRILFGLPTSGSRGGFEVHGSFFHVLGEDAFGHKGLGGSIAFASPSKQLAFAHVVNLLDLSTLAVNARTMRLLEAIEHVISQNSTP